jgi:poly(3-hydroxybutyrate) depolymerase/predicted alpha/beta-hydrolase family hydrolase
MKPIILLASLVLVFAACSSADSTSDAATTPPTDSSSGELHEGLPVGDESFDLYVPASYEGSEPVPVVIALHGRPRSSVESQARLQPLADEQHFIVAYPRIDRQRWQPELDSPDIDVMRELIAELIDTWNADPDRVYVTGMSAGGDMAISIGVQLSDLVAAIAPVAPPAGDRVAELVRGHSTAVPVVAFVGAEDTRFADNSLDLLASWRDSVACGQEDRTAAEELTTSTWRCDDGAEMTVHVLAGAGHVWFGGPGAREPLWASEAMWNFFTTVATTPDPAESAAAPGGEAYIDVEFTASDGEQRSGRLFGDGEIAVVLSHMGRSGDSQDDWALFAHGLADQGYQALTYERRPRLPEVWMDVAGAVDYLRSSGADTVIVGGASIGAMASLHAAGQADAEIDGLIWLAGVLRNRSYQFQEPDVSELGCPMLFISGDADSYGAADDTRQLHDWATGPSELLILDSRQHGTAIYEDGEPNASELTQAMLDFIERVAEDETDPC